jgi:hypothetical protein
MVWRVRGVSRAGLRVATGGVLVAAAVLLGPGVTAASPSPFIPGTATATSQAAQVGPSDGGLSAVITFGTSVADYRDNLAQASSQAVNLGVIGTSMTVQCDSTPPLAKPSQLPQPLVAESTHGNQQATKDTAGSGKSGLTAVAGREHVAVTTQPKANASFDGSQMDVPGLLAVSGLHSDSGAHLLAGQARVATSSADVGTIKLLGGAVVLSGMHWTAMARSGQHPAKSTTFSVGSATLAGHRMPVGPSQLASTTAAINKAIAMTGLHLTLPTRGTRAGTLSESPLTIGIDDSTLGGSTLNPLLGAIQPVTDDLQNLIIGASCKLGNGLTVAELTLGALDGTGGLDLDVGGATANTNGKVYADPFARPKLGGGRTGSNPASTSSAPATTRGASGGSVPGVGSGKSGGAPSSVQPQLAGSISTSQSCASLSPAHRPSCSSGEGLAVGLIALGTVGSVAAADFFMMRRRRRMPAVAL